ncbi:MAG TPA: biotin/lipoyl-binding protein, partial [Ignavibacteriaceae bacterium]|nr:biotin/lipoyl-binding protein [Ignavibacteriaceae bacterium]
MENKNADLSSLKINRASTPDSSGGKSKLIKILISIIVLALVIFGIISLWNNLISPATEVSLVTASKISPSESDAILTGSGYVVAQRKASVASKATGRLVYLGVVEGDAVKKGQTIARLEDNDIKAQLKQAKANLQ